jgi:putative phage-type endonuclease
MEYDVTIDRDKYIGGSDIPVILGISPFKTRWELLQEKAGLKVDEFTGNQYTEYGNIMEPKIREYANEFYGTVFEPDQVIKDDLRGNCDGFNGDTILEIKTTSQIHDYVGDYKTYLVQLLFYMALYGVKKGILAVYYRPEDFIAEFDEKRLSLYSIDGEQYQTILYEINAEIERFRADLERLRNNPLLSEQDFQPAELVEISRKVVEIERRMAEYKALEAEQKKVKQALFEAMEKHNVKSWETPAGIKITRVDAVSASTKTVTEFDEETFKAENPALYGMYQHDVEKKTAGKAGYIKVTIPKGA